MVANQTECCQVEQRFVIKYLVVESANHVEFTVESMTKHVLITETFIYGLNMCMPLRSCDEKSNSVVEARGFFYIVFFVYLFGLYGISTFVGYLMPNPFYTNEQF